MFKKILLASAILAVTSGVAIANPAPYIGASLGIQDNTTSNGGNGSPGYFRGVPVSLFAGYGGLVSQSFYLAGELTGTLGTATLSSKNGVKTSYGYGLSILPGFMLSDRTMAFVRGGVIRTRFTTQNSTRTGGLFGLGLQTCVTQNVDIRGEYDYMAYSSVGGVTSPRTDAFNLGLVYKFD